MLNDLYRNVFSLPALALLVALYLLYIFPPKTNRVDRRPQIKTSPAAHKWKCANERPRAERFNHGGWLKVPSGKTLHDRQIELFGAGRFAFPCASPSPI